MGKIKKVETMYQRVDWSAMMNVFVASGTLQSLFFYQKCKEIYKEFYTHKLGEEP